MSLEKTDAIVIRLVDFSETSCVVTLFSRDYGKIAALAKGARRPLHHPNAPGIGWRVGGPRMSEREVSQIHARVTKSILAKDCACDQIRKL